MSRKDRSSLTCSDSLSQGEDYESLLNDSLTEKYHIQEQSRNKIHSAKSEVKDTLNYLEEDVNSLGNEVMNLRSNNCYLEAQLEVLQKEKEMHISSHAKEKLRLEGIIKDLKGKLEKEQKEFSRQIGCLKLKLQEFESFIEKERRKRTETTKKYKEILETREKELLGVIRDKEKYIHQLQTQLEQGKCSRVCGFNPIHAAHKRNISKKSVYIPSAKSHNVSDGSKSESRLDNITDIIVRMEKEQAEFNQSISDMDFSQTNEKSKRSLRELMQKNEEKLKEAKDIQHSLLKERFSSTYS